MSFSQSVKDEILKSIRKIKGCCATSFLTAVFRSVGFTFDGSFVNVESDNGALLEFCANLVGSQFGIEAQMGISRLSETSDNVKYSCKFGSELIGKSVVDLKNFGRSDKLLLNKRECCKKAYMQALFLSCGSVSVPESDTDSAKQGNYHLELRFSDAAFADSVSATYAQSGFRQTTRKNIIVLYLKGGEKIADFLVYVGAVNAKFRLEDIIIERSFRNNANRQSNCIDSNIGKAVAASVKQRASIESLIADGRFATLPDQLKEIAIVRMDNPDATLAEIAAILGISKSGANHRLARLMEIADKPIA